MLLVYTTNLTSRLRYSFKHICTRILGIQVDFTGKIEEFIAHDNMKMTYARQPLGQEIFIKSHDLLFEQGLEDVEINVQTWGDTKCFFATSEKSSLPFDIFAATFYMLSRYEEYLPHVKDDFGRFLAKESLGFKHGFIHQPVVDIWAYKFKEALIEAYPDIQFPSRKYNIQPVIDVPIAYYFLEKGLLRNIGGSIKDLFRLKLRNFYQRYLVLFGFIRDPYDTFKWIITKQKQYPFRFMVFFLIGDYSTYDKNISTHNKRFVSLIKSVSDYCNVGLKVSYFAIEDEKMMKKEKQRLEDITNQPLNASRNSFSKVNLPETYRSMVELEIHEDYTMGYISELGFRAGSCTPFQFYDLDYEIQTPLQINSYHCIDSALLKHLSLLDKKQVLERLINTIKSVNGTFTPVFHNYSFSSEAKWKGFKKLFNQILESADEIE
ncbi:hypothetical protein SAMN03097699_3253 [Flavobacteriaceae bacterium MAR_2010_188]|nr:hypothetical protein SAMN03097699_3253 [Flavobacteriaceae bacterium MAR_2010_188]